MTHASMLEALLFAHGAPMEGIALRRLTGWDEGALRVAAEELREQLSGRGMVLQQWQDRYELVSHPEAAPLIRQFREDEARTELSKTALETIAVFLYKGALTRPELEEIRGMYSHQILRSLLRRGLITELAEQRVGQPVYDITPVCMQWLGLTRREDLPEYSTFLASHDVATPLPEGENASHNTTSGVE